MVGVATARRTARCLGKKPLGMVAGLANRAIYDDAASGRVGCLDVELRIYVVSEDRR